MTPILTQAIAAICRERDTRFVQAFKLVDQLLAEYGENDLANRLFAEIPCDVPFEIVTDLLDILSGAHATTVALCIGRLKIGCSKIRQSKA